MLGEIIGQFLQDFDSIIVEATNNVVEVVTNRTSEEGTEAVEPTEAAVAMAE